MRRDRLKWNRKYRREAFADQPAAIVRTYAHLAPMGRALDVACGNGRNACYLAGRGFAVDAVDIALEGLQRFACRLLHRAQWVSNVGRTMTRRWRC